MEKTAFARTVSLLPNGSQKLAAARETLFILDELVAREGIDFDGATACIREWIDSPVQMDSPAPVSGQAVLVLTIHQAKGLEFPVVVLWDGFAKLGARADGSPWKVTRDGNWAIQLEGLKAGSKAGRSLIEQERAIEKEEKKRLYYVAATRARDLLVIPMPNQGKKDKISHVLAGDLAGEAVLRMEEYKAGDLPEWAESVNEAPVFPEIRFASAKAEKQLREGWKGALWESARPIAVPVAVTALAHAKKDAVETSDLSGERDAGQSASRFGPEFGATVHASLSAILRGSRAEIEKVVSACAARSGLEKHIDEAIKDVQRALVTLERIGLLAGNVARYPEYPVVMPDNQGQLITGYIDVVAYAPDCIWIIDFKTDPPPAESVDISYPAYQKQIELYSKLFVDTIGSDKKIRSGLLFSADGVFYK
jgi:ATP-dependent helicase/nuclease subunit A